MNKRFYVYVIGPDSGFPCKIGVAMDPRKRLCSLQVSHWEALDIYQATRMPNRAIAYKIEKIIKKRLKAYCIRGEWFNVLASDMMKELDSIVIELEKSAAAQEALTGKRNIESYYL